MLIFRRPGEQGRRTIDWTVRPRPWNENVSLMVSTPTQRSADSWTCKRQSVLDAVIFNHWIYMANVSKCSREISAKDKTEECRWNCSLCRHEREASEWTWSERTGWSSSMPAGTLVMTLRLSAGCTGILSSMIYFYLVWFIFILYDLFLSSMILRILNSQSIETLLDGHTYQILC